MFFYHLQAAVNCNVFQRLFMFQSTCLPLLFAIKWLFIVNAGYIVTIVNKYKKFWFALAFTGLAKGAVCGK